MRAWFLVASVFCLLVSSLAFALTIERDITAEYVRSHQGEFSVKAVKDRNGLIAFTVVLALAEPRYVVAHLAVRDADRIIAESHTPVFTRNSENQFHFSIALEYVPTSEFSLSVSPFATSAYGATPIPGTIVYRIRLTEFVPAEALESTTLR
jgi:hypothetical protein